MRSKTKLIAPAVLAAVLVAALAAVTTMAAAKPAKASGAAAVASGAGRSFEVGLGIEFGEKWISLDGIIDLDGRTGRAHVLRVGAIPNVFRQAQKGCVLVRALGRAAGCVVRHCLRECTAETTGKEGR